MENNLDTKMWSVWCRKKYEKSDAKNEKKNRNRDFTSVLPQHGCDKVGFHIGLDESPM
jgi:hypothetical protein